MLLRRMSPMTDMTRRMTCGGLAGMIAKTATNPPRSRAPCPPGPASTASFPTCREGVCE
jgi:hypothetical protein